MKKLYTPVKINQLELKNRVVMSPMSIGHTVEGWTTLMGSVWALGGIQLLCLGILGEYIGKIYKEVKHRPRFVVDQFLNG